MKSQNTMLSERHKKTQKDKYSMNLYILSTYNKHIHRHKVEQR